MQDNVSNLSCAILVWNSERKGFGPWSNKPASSGNHQLWWNNNKIAISSKTNTTIHDPNGQVSSNQEMTFTTYDGKKFRVAEFPVGLPGKVELGISKKRPSDWYEINYLQRVGWQGSGGVNDVSEATEAGVELWSTETTEDGSRLIKREFRNEMDQIGVWYYDVAQGGMLVSTKHYYKQQLRNRSRAVAWWVRSTSWAKVIQARCSSRTGALDLPATGGV